MSDTLPFVRSRRIGRRIRIEEKNASYATVLDVVVEYPSDALPEWFAPLRPIVEDETFTSMVIHLGEQVRYHITLVAHL